MRWVLLAGLAVGTTAAALVATAAAHAWGADAGPERSAPTDRAASPGQPPGAPAAASPSTGAPAAWSPGRKQPRVSAGVLVRAASRRAKAATPPAPPERRRGREAGIVSIEIDWHAGSPAP